MKSSWLIFGTLAKLDLQYTTNDKRLLQQQNTQTDEYSVTPTIC